MDRGRALAAYRGGRDDRGAAVRDRHRVGAGAQGFRGKALLDGIVHLPLVLPPVVTGYLLLIWFGRRGVIGLSLADTFGIVFSFRWTGAALACGVMGFPLLVRAIRLSFEAVDAKLEDAAWTLGATACSCSPP